MKIVSRLKDHATSVLVTKESIQTDEEVDFQSGYRWLKYKFPICALDIKPPTYKVKE